MVKQNSKKSKFPQNLKIGNKIKTGENKIANESFLKRVNTTLLSQSLSINELKDAFFFLKTNKSPGADEINFNIIKHCVGELCGPLKYLFVYHDKMGYFQT